MLFFLFVFWVRWASPGYSPRRHHPISGCLSFQSSLCMRKWLNRGKRLMQVCAKYCTNAEGSILFCCMSILNLWLLPFGQLWQSRGQKGEIQRPKRLLKGRMRIYQCWAPTPQLEQGKLPGSFNRPPTYPKPINQKQLPLHYITQITTT